MYRFVGVAVAVVIAAAIVGVAVPLVATSTPEFFSRYHLLERRYVNLEDSAHEGIGCRTCHETQALVNGLELVADFYTGLIETTATPQYFTFDAPTNDACLSCHVNDWSIDASRNARIPHPAHTRVASETRPCTGCHKWTAHFETYLDKHKEMPFSGVCVAYGCHVGTKAAEQCYDCHHVLHESNEQWRTEHPAVIRATGQNACLEGCHTVAECQQCHTTGERPVFDGLPIEVSMKSIEVLHVRDDWTEDFHGTEALRGRDRCLLCHQDEGECGECHRERPAFHGPVTAWIGRHKNHTSELDDPRCTECHEQAYCDDCHRQFKEME
ncbi:MAG: NapC/NirT family cytochrome c [Coriobacteriia bacterium]|nr:NapC/NirT family cytochrome c [Coriobacteriia bacterium]